MKNSSNLQSQKITISKPRSIVSLWLDDYDNIFSDFDPRPFSQRALSDDFLTETSKVTSEFRPGSIDISFLMPRNKRNEKIEEIIRIRLHSHFRKNTQKLEKEKKSNIFKGLGIALFGIIAMFTAAATLHTESDKYFMSVIRIILEPSGWFAAWYGMDQMFYTANKNNTDLDFSRKMAHANLKFDSY